MKHNECEVCCPSETRAGIAWVMQLMVASNVPKISKYVFKKCLIKYANEIIEFPWGFLFEKSNNDRCTFSL